MSFNVIFETAAKRIKSFSKRPADDDLLEVYALYKQSKIGDVNVEKPGLLDVKGKAKWEAWNALKGMTTDAAKEAYIEKIEQLAVTHE